MPIPADGRSLPGAATALAALPPHEPALFSVAWAGEDVSENWMHVGREYTEWWHHQAQIRDAVGAPGLFGLVWFRPLLDLSVRVLPVTYRDIDADPGSSLVLEVEGPGGGTWTLARGPVGWEIAEGAAASPSAVIRLDEDTAWKSFYSALDPSLARARAHAQGDERLILPFFRARSVMVTRLGAG